MNNAKSKIATIAKSFRLIGRSPHSHLYIVIDSSRWVLSTEAKYLLNHVQQLGISSEVCQLGRIVSPAQCFHHTSQFDLLHSYIGNRRDARRRSFDIFHGHPDQGSAFKEMYDKISRTHDKIHRIRVSCSSMESLVLATGIDRTKVFRIPIAVDSEMFNIGTPELKNAVREQYGIPQSATVIGSFQKDGNGWGAGNEPKHIKGPDILLQVLKILKSRIPDLYVLISGPARGYVKNGLGKLSIPYHHVEVSEYREIASLYHALDLYLVTSREEGGPKAVLESMASGIPLVTTRVGQAADLVRHKHNGFLVDVEDVDGLANMSEEALRDTTSRESIIRAARQTACENAVLAQKQEWKSFFTDFVSF